MKAWFLLLTLISLACCTPSVDHKQRVVPKVTFETTEQPISRQGALVLNNGTPLSGYMVKHYEDGQLKSKVGYINGLKEGPAFEYYADGTMKESRNYASNRKHGQHLGWWPNGSQKFDYTFENGLQQGQSLEWFESGQMLRVNTYVNGKEDGPQKMWEMDGKIRANYVVREGHRYGLIGLKNCKSVSNEKGVFTARAY